MLAPSVGSKDKVAGEVRDAFRKYNFSQKKYKVDLYGQPVSYWKSTFYEYCNSAPDWGKLIRTYGTILLALLFVPALNLLSAYSDVIPEGVDSFLTPGMLLNPVVIGITFLVSLILNVLSALIPALHALKKDIVYSLNDKR